MIVYKDILGKLKDAGYTTTRIRKEGLLPESTLQRIRNNNPDIKLSTMERICNLIGCELSDVVEFRKE